MMLLSIKCRIIQVFSDAEVLFKVFFFFEPTLSDLKWLEAHSSTRQLVDRTQNFMKIQLINSITKGFLYCLRVFWRNDGRQIEQSIGPVFERVYGRTVGKFKDQACCTA